MRSFISPHSSDEETAMSEMRGEKWESQDSNQADGLQKLDSLVRLMWLLGPGWSLKAFWLVWIASLRGSAFCADTGCPGLELWQQAVECSRLICPCKHTLCRLWCFVSKRCFSLSEILRWFIFVRVQLWDPAIPQCALFLSMALRMHEGPGRSSD